MIPGTFAIRLAERVRAHLRIPCDIIQADEVEIVSQLAEVDVLVTMAFTPEIGAASRQLKLVQVPGAGLDRLERAALDVWYQYPTAPCPTLPARHAFQELPEVLMTPHVSGWTEGMLAALGQCIAENIHRVAQGKPPVQLISASAE
jgi:phosphoglycerate dehydrogenase-like enzyme